MKQTKTSNQKTNSSTKRTNPSKSKKATPSKRFTKPYLIALTLVILGLGVGVSALLPQSSPLSLASLTGKGTDRVAPKMDTLTGNYSVEGEATSTSLLVKYKDSIPENSRADIHRQLGASVKRRIAPLGVDVVQVTSTESVGETMRKYTARPEVEYVEPNYLAKRFLTPDDSLYSKQWNLQKIEAPKAWDTSQGGFGPIAIIDTGVMSSQADLNGYVQTGYNFVSDNTDTNDDNGHGTHVAGIVSASTNNSTGVASIGFKGSLLPVKVLDSTGAGTYGDVASGIIFATDKGAKIINMSLGGSSSSRTLEDAVKYALSRGVVVVAAAGNNGNDTAVYPAAYSGVIAVTASTQDDNLASFSSYGNHVYISAPGVGIISTYNSGGYATLSGTSMAAPEVAGLIGLALSKGTTTATNVLNDLKTASDKVGPYAYDQNGWNQYFGYGRINAAKLLGVVAVSQTVATSDKTTTSDKPANNSQRSSRSSKAATEATNPQFDTVIEGSIDSIDFDRSVIAVKVSSSSNNLQLSANNLIDLNIKPDTIIKSGGNVVQLSSLKVGDKLNIKAQWKDNQLNAKEIILLGRTVNTPQPAGRRP